MCSIETVNVPAINETIQRLLLSNNFVRSYSYRRLTRDDTIMEKFQVAGKPSSSSGVEIFLIFCVFVIPLLLLSACAFFRIIDALKWFNNLISIRSRRPQNLFMEIPHNSLKDMPLNSLLKPKITTQMMDRPEKKNPQIMDRPEKKNSLSGGGTIVRMPSSAENARYRWSSPSGDIEIDRSTRVYEVESASEPTIKFDDVISILYLDELAPIKKIDQSNLKKDVETMRSSEDDVCETQNSPKKLQALKASPSNDTPTDDFVMEEDVKTSLEDDVCETRNLSKKSRALDVPLNNDTPTNDLVTEKEVETSLRGDVCETRNSPKKSQPFLRTLSSNDIHTDYLSCDAKRGRGEERTLN